MTTVAIAIAVVAVVVVAAIALIAWRWLSGRRSERLRSRFGPEYDRTVAATGSERAAERDLTSREKRREELEIRPLPEAARRRYSEQWRDLQGRFVDAPEATVAGAHALVLAVMSERGYPVTEFDQRAADVSVDHPQVVENYRAAHALTQRSADGVASTEELRQAVQLYRTLFDDLLAPAEDAPVGRSPDADADLEQTGTSTQRGVVTR